MDETLKAIRIIHIFLIIISATLLTFFLSPDKSRQYQAALTELATLKQLTDNDYTSFVRSSIEQERVADFKRDASRSTKYHISDELKITVPFECEHFGKNTSLEDFYSFFEGPNRVVQVSLLPTGWMLEEAVTDYDRSIPSDAVLTDIAIMIPQNKPPFDAKEEREMKGADLKTTIQFTLRVVRAGGSYTGYYFPTVHRNSLSWGPYTNSFAMDWLRSKPNLYTQLVYFPSPNNVIFPSLRFFWNNIRGMTVNEAARFLQEKLDSTTRQVSFFGISVEGSVIVWVGPLITLLFMVYFLSHLKHLLANLEQTKTVIKDFPWIGLFNDTTSVVLTYASIGLFPIIVNLILLWKTGQGKEPTTILGWLITCCLIISASLAVITIKHLQTAKHRENTYASISDNGQLWNFWD